MFAPRYGIQEESATGMAAGPLACYLREHVGFDKQEFFVEQGRWMAPPSPSVINVRLHIGVNGNIESLFAGGRGAIKETVKVEF
ncbi:MAG: PhzF family phenazine biosynthesis protein [Marinobacter sp.]|uniref:PhzF family phenazine biosynthesis protein n=1 Tax=Marinobacter sp. TaxID=50741 RepID=UPI00329820E2